MCSRCWRGLSLGLGLGDAWPFWGAMDRAGTEALRGGGGATLRGMGGEGRSEAGLPLGTSTSGAAGCCGGVPGIAATEALPLRPRRGDSVYWCTTRLLCDDGSDAGRPMDVSES